MKRLRESEDVPFLALAVVALAPAVVNTGIPLWAQVLVGIIWAAALVVVVWRLTEPKPQIRVGRPVRMWMDGKPTDLYVMHVSFDIEGVSVSLESGGKHTLRNVTEIRNNRLPEQRSGE